GCEADCTISHGILPRSTLPHGALPASPSSCGNGTLDRGEACDDGNNQDGDGCEADCTLPRPAPPPPAVATASLPCPADALAGIQCELARAPLDSCPGRPASGPFKDFLSQWETSIRLALAAAEDHADATTGRDRQAFAREIMVARRRLTAMLRKLGSASDKTISPGCRKALRARVKSYRRRLAGSNGTAGGAGLHAP